MRNLILLLVAGMFFVSLSSAVLTNVTLLNETFDSGDLSNWTTDWDIATDQFVSSPNSLACTDEDSTLQSIDLDTSDATHVYVSFRYRIQAIDANDDINLEYYDGTVYDIIDEIGDDAEDTWLTYSETVTDTQYFISNFRLYIDGTSIDSAGAETLWLDDIVVSKQYDANTIPSLSNITASHSTIQGGATITIYANSTDHGLNDTDGDTLILYCDNSTTPNSTNTDCTGGTTTDASDPYDLSCSFAVETDDTTHVEYCRVYDGTDYSNLTNVSYTTDSTPPTTSVTSVAGDTSPSYFDSVNDGTTEINISGEASMVCRWSSIDLVYDSMANDCTISGTSASCNINDVGSQGLHTRYISCEDQYGNGQNTSQNLDVQFYLDYTAPTTTDNSNSNIQAPPYVVTITEQDNVDSDPTTLYCTDTTNTCAPSLSIDDGGTITFTSANRGVNYLRYNSTDDAGNQQSTVSKTININQLPIFTSASDNATNICGGAIVNITTVSIDPDAQQLTLYVCDSASATFEGCGGNEYCSSVGSANLSCTFASENDSATHTWYAYIFDDSDEGASNNPLTGSYTTDVTGPTITVVSPTNSTYTQSSVTFTITVNEALASAWYSVDSGVNNVSMTNTSLLVYTHTNLSIADGSYDVKFWANDSCGNMGNSSITTFSIDTTVADTTPPTITVISPTNGTYDLDGTVLLNITSNEALNWAGWQNGSDAIQDLGNVSTTNWNATITFAEDSYSLTFYANDTSGNQGNESVVFYVDLANPSVEAFSCTDVNDSEDVVCSANVSDVIGLDYAIIGHNATGSWQNSSQISLDGVNDSLSYTIAAGNHSPIGFTSYIYLYDDSGRTNFSESDSIVISDDTFPLWRNITYTPSSSDDLDPGVSVDVNVTIEEDFNISSVVLMYQNISSGVWNSITMTNNSALTYASNSNVTYNATFVPQNGTWVFKINVTDAGGNVNMSSNTTIVVTNDTSQNISTTIPLTKSIYYSQRTGNNSLGDLVMNNTGDGSLGFNVTVVSSSIENRLSINYTGNQSVNFSAINSGDAINITIDVNTTDLTAGIYSYNVSVVSEAGSETFERQLNVQTAAGPYLDVSIDTYPTSVTAGDSGVELVASVTNLGTADATGVYLNWSLPSIFTLASGSLSRNLGNLPVSTSGSNTITVSVSSSAFASTVNLTAIATSSNADSANDTKEISVSGAAAPVTTTTVSGGGGGGGSIVGAIEQIEYSKTIEIVRGGEESFEIEVYNNDPTSNLENLELEMSGFLSQYITIIPKKIGLIGPKETKSFVIKVEVPPYKEDYEEYTLKAVIRGRSAKLDESYTRSYIETQNILLIIQEVDNEATSSVLSDAERAIEEMKARGFNVAGVSELFKQAELKLSENRNKESFELSNEILEIKSKAFEVDNLIRRVAEALENPRRSYLLVQESYEDFEGSDLEVSLDELISEDFVFVSQSVGDMFDLAIVAFMRGDYSLAEERILEARNLLVLERKGNIGIFFYLYWPYVSLAFVGLMLSGVIGYRHYKKSSVSKRIFILNKQEENVRKLLHESQKQYFLGKKSGREHHSSVEQYQRRIGKIRKERLTLRNRRIKLLRVEQVTRDLRFERVQVENEIKKLQVQYYKDKKISDLEYKNQFEILNERLAEIEGEKTTLDLLGENKRLGKKPKRLGVEVKKAEKKLKSSGRFRIAFLKFVGFFKNPFRIFGKKKIMTEGEIRKTIKKMGVK